MLRPCAKPGEDGAIWPELLAPRTAHQLVDRHAKLLADKVVQRDVDRRDRVDAEPAPAWPEGAIIELLPDGGNLERIFSD